MMFTILSNSQTIASCLRSAVANAVGLVAYFNHRGLLNSINTQYFISGVQKSSCFPLRVVALDLS